MTHFEKHIKMRKIMRNAWRIARQAVKDFGGNVREYFSGALKEAHRFERLYNSVTRDFRVDTCSMRFRLSFLFMCNCKEYKHHLTRHMNCVYNSYIDLVDYEVVISKSGNKKLDRFIEESLCAYKTVLLFESEEVN